MSEPIDFTKMPYDEAVSLAIRVFGIGIAQAEERISIMQGLVTGDVLEGSEKGGRGSGNWAHAGIRGHVGGSAPKGGAGSFGYEYPLKKNPHEVPWQDFRIAGKSGAQWVEDSDRVTQEGRNRLSEQLNKNADLDKGAIDGYLNKIGNHRRLVIEEALQVAQKYNLTTMEQRKLMSNLVNHDTIDKYDAKVATPYVKYMMTKNADDDYWAAVNLHHDVNSHHAEYWVNKRTHKPRQVPTITIIEMAGDWRATSRTFNTPLDGYYRKYGAKRADTEFNMHPKTRQAAERELGITDNPFPDLFPAGFKEYGPGLVPSMGIEAILADLEPSKKTKKAVKKWGNKVKKSYSHLFGPGYDANPEYKGGAGSGNWRHAGIPGKVGGSSPGGGLGALTALPEAGLQRWNETDAKDAHSDFHGEESWKDWHNKLTENEAWAMQRYVGAPGDHWICDDMNAGLRKGTFDPDADPSSEMSRVFRALDTAVNRGRLHKNSVLYRTIDYEPMYTANGTGRFSPGHVISDKGFCSTAPTKKTATVWVQMGWVKNPVMFKIKAPKGSKGAYMSWKERIRNPYMEDSEFLMPRKQRFRIDGVSEEMINGRRVVVYEMTTLR